jgi:hypothetical protein
MVVEKLDWKAEFYPEILVPLNVRDTEYKQKSVKIFAPVDTGYPGRNVFLFPFAEHFKLPFLSTQEH